MRRPDKPDPPDEPLLFDLPLGGPEREPEPPPPARRKQPERPAREGRSPAAGPAATRSGPVPVPDPEPDEKAGRPSAKPASEFAGRGRRLGAGLADLLVHAAVLVGALLGTRWMGVKPDPVRDWPALAVFLLSFSFLYTVLPLAFWGQTLGMAWTNITSRNRDGEPLTFDQTARRWLTGLVTAALLGLPALVSGRRSLSDLVSGSATYPGGE
ncbi:MAG TPA: RDD family protein [Thermoanaerobaculia bacterium]|nr:RDD family protein [Thermoanaerobaculia bacterium]